MAEDFLAIALGQEWGKSDRRVIRKWRDPIRVTLSGVTDRPFRNVVDRRIAELGRLTGHPIAWAENGGGNFEIWHASERERKTAAAEFGVSGPMLKRLDHTNCFFLLRVSRDGDIFAARVVIPRDLPDTKKHHCAAEETAQALGLANDDAAIEGSIFSDNAELPDLTQRDRTFLRLLYDARIRSGMIESDARRTVLAILSE